MFLNENTHTYHTLSYTFFEPKIVKIFETVVSFKFEQWNENRKKCATQSLPGGWLMVAGCQTKIHNVCIPKLWLQTADR